MNTPASAGAAPGWQGKLPTLGDFASRRLDADFIEAWDLWLAEGLAHLQESDGKAWLQAYLDSPVWRFLLMPGVLRGAAGERAWVGILMPSVDRVGRYFPFTIAQALPGLPTQLDDCRKLADWLDRVGTLAVDALYDDWNIDRLEQELQQAVLPVLAAASTPASVGPGSPVHIERLSGAENPGLVDLLLAQAMAAFGTPATGLALWLGSAQDGQRRMLRSHGLPRKADFAALLGQHTADAS